MRNAINVLFLALVVLFTAVPAAGCAQRDDDGSGPDGGTGGDDIAPPSNSGSWACRSGVADGITYIEFRPGYLNGGTVDMAYIVGQADAEGIYGYFHGSYDQVGKHSGSGWYRFSLTGPVGSTGVLTYASKVDLSGTDSSAWAQYGGSLSAEAAGPFRWNSSGTNYACRYRIDELGKPAAPYSN